MPAHPTEPVGTRPPLQQMVHASFSTLSHHFATFSSNIHSTFIEHHVGTDLHAGSSHYPQKLLEK